MSTVCMNNVLKLRQINEIESVQLVVFDILLLHMTELHGVQQNDSNVN